MDESEPEKSPKADFHAFNDRVCQYLGIDDPAKTEDYKLGSGLGHDPNMFRMEQSSRPPSLKLPLMDDIAKLLQNQDTVVKPGPSSSTSLDIGQFMPNPPNRGNWYPVAGETFEQTWVQRPTYHFYQPKGTTQITTDGQGMHCNFQLPVHTLNYQ